MSEEQPRSLVSRSAIEALIPHGQSMCLLDGVQRWDRDRIIALCFSHHQPGNPLLHDGRLTAATLVEYGAQAAAVHAGLTDTGLVGDQAGFIGAIKGLVIHRPLVPADTKVLYCHAECTFNNGSGAIYQIAVDADKEPIAQGRIVLVTPGSDAAS